MKIRLFSDFDSSDILLKHLENQTPSMKNGVYKDIQFVVNDDYNGAVVFNRPIIPLKSAKENNIGFLMDIPEICKPNMEVLKDVSRYFCWKKEWKSSIPGIYRDCPCSYMFFHCPVTEEKDVSMKNKRMSMVVSFKGITKEQRKRKQLFNALLKTDLDIDFYGRDMAGINDKRVKGPLPFMSKDKALLPYEYSISIENLVYDGWLTEKFYDCIINNTVPITNSPTAKSCFNNNGYILLDYNKPVNHLVNDVKDIYYSDEFSSRLESVYSIKDNILNGEYSLAEKIYKEITCHSPG